MDNTKNIKKEMVSIYSTSDMSIFEKISSNRDINKSKLKKLISNIIERDLLKYSPILVGKTVGGKFRIYDGQHRVAAVSTLNSPELLEKLNREGYPFSLYFQIADPGEFSAIDVPIKNEIQTSWVLKDYLHYYLDPSTTNIYSESYKVVDDFMKTHNLSLPVTLYLMGLSENYTTFKDGTLRVPSGEQMLLANKVAGIINHMRDIGPSLRPLVTQHKFIMSLYQFLQRVDVDPRKLKEKITKFSDRMKKHFTVSETLEEISKLYFYCDREKEGSKKKKIKNKSSLSSPLDKAVGTAINNLF